MRRQVGPGADPVAREQGREHPRRRRLPVGPGRWIDRNDSCGDPSGSSGAASARARSASRTARATPGSGRLASAPVGADRALPLRRRGLQLGQLGLEALELSRSPWTSAGGALSVNPLLESLPRARSISPAAACAPPRRARAPRPGRPCRRRAPRRSRRRARSSRRHRRRAAGGDVEPREAADRIQRIAVPVADDARSDARRRRGARRSRGSCAAAAPPRSPPRPPARRPRRSAKRPPAGMATPRGRARRRA